jgi:hypothetical protein
MGFKKKIRSKKAVDIDYCRIKALSLLEDGSLNIYVQGFVSGEEYGKGAEPIEEYRVMFEGADVALKAPFYGYLKTVPLFSGAIDDLTYSRPGDGLNDLPVTILNPKGDIVYHHNPQQPSIEPEQPAETGPYPNPSEPSESPTEPEQPPNDTSIGLEASNQI